MLIRRMEEKQRFPSLHFLGYYYRRLTASVLPPFSTTQRMYECVIFPRHNIYIYIYIYMIQIVNLKMTVQWVENINLKNVVYQADMPPPQKKHTHTQKKKKFILEFLRSDGNCDLITESILSLTNNWELKQQYPKLKIRGLTPIQWKILKKSTPCCFDGRWNLCLEEKIQIMMYIGLFNLLNQRYDFIARCRHRKKFSSVKKNNGINE